MICWENDKVETGSVRMNNKFIKFTAVVILTLLLLPVSGCGILGRKNSEKEIPYLTINRLWQVHQDVNYVYFYYPDGLVEKGLLLKWDEDKIQIQREGSDSPEFISSAGIISVKVVVGNRIWRSLTIGTALAAGYFFLSGANDLGGESLGSSVVKVFGAPLIILASVALGSGNEKTEEYLIPGDFNFDYEEIKRIHEITE
jgi:hypothetical protein